MEQLDTLKKRDALIKKLRLVNQKVFVAYFASKGLPRLQCPLCKGTNFSLPVENVGIVSSSGDEEYFEYIRPVLSEYLNYDAASSLYNLECYSYKAICNTCSHEMNFNTAAIVRWAEQMSNTVYGES